MSLTEEQLARLPKYARDRIKLLERNLEDAYAKISEGPDNSNVFQNPYSDAYRRPLGRDVTLQFGHDDGDHFVVKYESAKDRLDIIGYGRAHDRLAIAPRGGNCVHVVLAGLEH